MLDKNYFNTLSQKTDYLKLMKSGKVLIKDEALNESIFIEIPFSKDNFYEYFDINGKTIILIPLDGNQYMSKEKPNPNSFELSFLNLLIYKSEKIKAPEILSPKFAEFYTNNINTDCKNTAKYLDILLLERKTYLVFQLDK